MIKAEEKINTPIGDNKLDCVLLYDVIHDYYFDKDERQKLFKEMRRIMRDNGLLSIFPHHIAKDDFNKIQEELTGEGFKHRDEIIDTIIHDGSLITDSIYNYIKIK